MSPRRHALSNPREDAASSGQGRLCLVTHCRFPVGEPRAERAAKAASSAGFDVHVICLRGEGEARKEIAEGISIHRLRMSHKRGAGLLRMTYEYLGFAVLAGIAVTSMQLRGRLRVVQVHSPPDFLIAVGLIPRIFGAKLILDIRDLSPHLWDARFARRRFSSAAYRALVLVERAACALASDVITVHEPYRDELVRHSVKPQKIMVVMNTPDDSLIKPILEERGNPRAEDSFIVAYHGTVTSWYGVDLLIRGIAIASNGNPSIQGLIIGEGDALPAARALAADLGLADRIRFSGKYLPITDTLRKVAHADCGVIPNPPSELNRFILSNKLFEYIALGVPVVAAELETIAAHFNDQEITFFEPGNAQSLADALIWISSSVNDVRGKTERAIERAHSYSWAANRAKYQKLLTQS